jgi:hypothetical protein
VNARRPHRPSGSHPPLPGPEKATSPPASPGAAPRGRPAAGTQRTAPPLQPFPSGRPGRPPPPPPRRKRTPLD